MKAMNYEIVIVESSKKNYSNYHKQGVVSKESETPDDGHETVFYSFEKVESHLLLF